MSHEAGAYPNLATADTLPQESIDAFLDREFAAALATALAKAKMPESVQRALVEVANSASPDKRAWLNAVDPPPKAAVNG